MNTKPRNNALDKCPASSTKPSLATKANRNKPAAKTRRSISPVVTGPATNPAEPASQASKQARLLALLQSAQGATTEQIIQTTGWQPHSIRGIISGVLRKKMGLVVVLERAESGERRYRIQSPVMADERHDSDTVPA